jgi:hypothetical protein
VDGEGVFGVTDDSLQSGRVGVYAWKNTDAEFTELRAAPPFWAPFYVFERETGAPTGTRVRIHAGSARDWAPDVVGVARRFAASLDQPGRLTLTPGIELRLRGADASASHARAFIADADYAPVALTILRKADGTGFALFPAAGAFTKGQYRLRLEYRRNNQQQDPSSLVLRQAGSDASESVAIDIPWLTR